MLLSRLHVLITGDNSDARRALDDTGRAVDGAGSKMGAAAGMAGRAVALVGTAAVGLGSVVAGIGLNQAAASEQASIAFETMLGSAEAAEGFLTDLKAFAAETPFEFPELQSAASSLVSVGVETDKIIPIMTTLGNVTSGMGTGAEGVKRATVALQQMSAAGRITGEDLNQLRDAGIPVFDLLAAATGKSKEEVAALAQAGKLGKQELDQLMGALESGAGLEKFSGLMEKQSQSLSGMISTLKDTLTQGLGDAAAPLVDQIKEQLPGITEALTGVMGSLGPVFGAIGGMVTSLVPLIEPVASLVGSLATVFANIFGGVIEQLVPVFETLVPVIEEMAVMLGDGLAEVLPEVGEALLAIAQAVAPLLPQLLDLAMMALLPLVRIAAELIAVIAPLVGSFIESLLPAVEAVLEAIRPLLPVLQEALMTAIVALAPVLDQLALVFVDLITALLPILPGLVELLAAVVGLIPPLLTLALQVLVPLTQVLIPLIGLVAELAGWLAGGLAGAVDWVSEHLNDGFAKAIAGIADGLSDLIVWFIELPGDIGDAVAGFGTLLWDAGKDLIQGLLDGIASMAMAPVDFIKDIGSNMVDGFKDIWDINSPSRVAHQLTAHVGEGLEGGLVDSVNRVESAWGDLSSVYIAPDVTAAGVGMVAAGAAAGTVINMLGDIHVNGSDSDDVIERKVFAAMDKWAATQGSTAVRMTRGRTR